MIVAVGEALLAAGYSRDAERAADATAVDLMTRAGGNGAALADILERIAADDGRGGNLDLLRSHPSPPNAPPRSAPWPAPTRPGGRSCRRTSGPH